MLDSLATLGGPAAAAALLAASEPSVVFATCSAASLLGGLVVVALPYDTPPRGNPARRSAGRGVLEGFTTIARNRTLSLITTLGAVQTFTRGCLTVFTVVLAIDLLDTGNPGVGVLIQPSGPAASSARYTHSRWSGAAASPPGSGSGSLYSARP